MTRRGWILFSLLGIVWGLPYLLIKIAVAEIPVPVLVFLRVTLGAAFLLPLALRRAHLARLRGHWIPITAFATLEFITPWGLLSHAAVIARELGLPAVIGAMGAMTAIPDGAQKVIVQLGLLPVMEEEAS